MPSVSHSFECDGPVERVFDLVTTAKFWPQWHPATRDVEGDVDRPAQLGDRITEHVVIAGVEATGTWSVVECDRPHRLVLVAELPVGRFRINYEFTHTCTSDAECTRMRRDLEFPELGPAVAVAMQAQSAQGTEHLGRLVGELLSISSRVPQGGGRG